MTAAFHPIKLFACDLNWTMQDRPFRHCPPSAPHDWAFINPQEYFDWHQEFGNNVMFCQAWRKWVARGCDLMGYAWGTPPDFRPHPSYEAGMRIIRAAFAALPGVPR